MSTLEHSVGVTRDPEDVWDIVGDFGKDDSWRRVKKMGTNPPGPARAGTITHEVLRFMGSTCVTNATVTDVQPRRCLAYEGGGDGTTVRGYRRVEASPGETRFVEGIEIELSGPMQLLKPLLARLYARRLRAEASALKMLLER